MKSLSELIEDHQKSYNKYMSEKTKPMGGMISVKIVIDQLRSQIENHMMDHCDIIKASISHELERAIKNFDFELEVNKIVHLVLKTEIEKIVKQAVEQAVNTSKWMSDWISESVKHELESKRIN